ncbi:hypothetical protein U1Q18_015505 [Sarracenia purpurea var. burkii]
MLRSFRRIRKHTGGDPSGGSGRSCRRLVRKRKDFGAVAYKSAVLIPVRFGGTGQSCRRDDFGEDEPHLRRPVQPRREITCRENQGFIGFGSLGSIPV